MKKLLGIIIYTLSLALLSAQTVNKNVQKATDGSNAITESLTVGTGKTLAPTGSGVITATSVPWSGVTGAPSFEPSLGNPGSSGQVLSSTTGGARSWITPGATWGAITGTLSSQTDLQTALNGKEPTIAAGTTAQYWRGDKSWQTLNAAAVAGLAASATTDTTNASNITSGTLPNARIVSLPNANLANSSITIAGTATALGGAITLDGITGLASTGLVKRTAANTLGIATGGTDYEFPLTFSTGLTRTTNTVTVNASQSISTLSNLTTNGFVKTTGGTGALSIDTNTYLTGNQTVTLSGDVSGSGATAITTAIGAGKVTNAMLAGSIDLTAKVTGILPTANGGTGSAFFSIAGPTLARVYTLPDSAATLLYSGGALGTPASGVATNLTGTASGLTAGNVTTNANLTGDVTSVGNATTLGNIPTGVTMAGKLVATNIAAPATPAAGLSAFYFDSTSKNIASKNDAGTVNHGIQTRTASASNWIRSVADDGSTTISQPAFTDVSGSVAAGQMPALTGDVTSTAGTVSTTVGKINGTSLAGLATGILKNTTTTGVPSIAVSGTDYLPGYSGLTTNGVLQATGATTVASTLTPAGLTSVGANGVSSAALSNLTLGTGTFGTSVSFASATGIPTFNTHVVLEGVTSAGATGTGNLVYSGGPSFTGNITSTGTYSSSNATSGNSLYSATGSGYASFQNIFSQQNAANSDALLVGQSGTAYAGALGSVGNSQAFLYSPARFTIARGTGATNGFHFDAGGFTITPTTDSTSSTTGSIVISGGAGIAKNLTTGAGRSVSVTTNTATSLTLDGTMHVVTLNNAAAVAVTLPALASNTGRAYRIKNLGAGVVTVTANASENIFTNSNVNSFQLATGDSVDLTATAANWLLN